MVKTLLLYDGKMSSAERIAKKLCYIIGNARVAEITEAPEDLSSYGGFCFVFNFYGSLTTGKTKNFLVANRELLTEKRIALVGIGFSDLGYAKYIVDMQAVVGEGEITALFISNENQTVSAGYEVGRFMRAAVRKMDDGELLSEIERYIRAHSIMALASAADGYVRCTPVAYSYLDQVFYVLTKGGNKFRGIFVNDKVSLAIFDPDSAGSTGSGLQVYGSAQAVPTDSAEYEVIMAAKKLTPEVLESMGVTQFLLKITPLKYEFRNEAFEAAGYDALQELNTTFQLKNWEAGAAYAEMEERRLEALKRAAEEEAEEETEESASGPEEEETEASAPAQLPEDGADAEVFAEDAQEEDKRYRFFGGGLKKLIDEEEDEGFDFDEEKEAEEAAEEDAAAEEEEEAGFVDEAEEEAAEDEAAEAAEEEGDWFAEGAEDLPETPEEDVFSIHIADPEEFLTREEQEQIRAARQKTAEAAQAAEQVLPEEAEDSAEEEAADEPEEETAETFDPGKDPEAEEPGDFVSFGEPEEEPAAEEEPEAADGESFFTEAEDLGDYEEVDYSPDDPEAGEDAEEESTAFAGEDGEFGEASEEEYEDFGEEDEDEYGDFGEEDEEKYEDFGEEDEEAYEDFDEEDEEEYEDFGEEDEEAYEDFDEEDEEEYEDFSEEDEEKDGDPDDFDIDDLGEEDEAYERRRAERKARTAGKAAGWKERLLKFFHLNETEEKEADGEDEEGDYEEYGEEEKPETYSAFGYDRDFKDEYDEDEELLHAIPRGKSGGVSSRFLNDDDDDLDL